MKSLCIQSPAKLNLFLNVGNKRPDGYHEIETIFERISLCDEIELSERAHGIEVKTLDPSLSCDADNLVHRAARALKETCSVDKGVSISLQKNIPIGAGLGGGSSNAASVLKGLVELWQLDIAPAQLHAIAGSLGADVPFFLMDACRALGRGKGEELTPLSGDHKFWYIVVSPEVKLSTAWVYSQYQPSLGLTDPLNTIKLFTHAFKYGRPAELAENLFNSLETVAERHLPCVRHLKSALLTKGSLGSLMSGSGSCVFGVAATREQAEKVTHCMRDTAENSRVFCVTTYSP